MCHVADCCGLASLGSASIDGSVCCLCLAAPRTVRVGPCGHASLCVECFDRVMQQNRLCPICRVPITSQKSSTSIVREPTFVPNFRGDPLPLRPGTIPLAPPAPAVEEGRRGRGKCKTIVVLTSIVLVGTIGAVITVEGVSHMHVYTNARTHTHTQARARTHTHTHAHAHTVNRQRKGSEEAGGGSAPLASPFVESICCNGCAAVGIGNNSLDVIGPGKEAHVWEVELKTADFHVVTTFKAETVSETALAFVFYTGDIETRLLLDCKGRQLCREGGEWGMCVCVCVCVSRGR